MGVNGARNAILHFVVKFGRNIILNGACFFDISDSSRFNNISNVKSFNGLVLRDDSGTVFATDGLSATATVLRASVISSFPSPSPFLSSPFFPLPFLAFDLASHSHSFFFCLHI